MRDGSRLAELAPGQVTRQAREEAESGVPADPQGADEEKKFVALSISVDRFEGRARRAC